MPPIEASAPGSIGKNSPLSRRCALSALRVMPGSTTQSRSSACTASTRSMRDRSIDRPPCSALRWPSSEVPAPNGTIGASCAAQMRDRVDHVLAALGEQHRVRRRVGRPGQGVAVLDAHRLRCRDLVAEMRGRVADQRRDGLGRELAFAPADDRRLAFRSCLRFTLPFERSRAHIDAKRAGAAIRCATLIARRQRTNDAIDQGKAVDERRRKSAAVAPWTGPFAAPPFSNFRAEHFRPAFDAALAERRAEIAAIKANPAPADFRQHHPRAGAGRARRSIACRACSSISPAPTPTKSWRRSSARSRRSWRAKATRSSSTKSFSRRVDAGECARRRQGSMRRRAGSSNAIASPSCARAPALDAERKKRLAEIGERLASLGAAFGQNVLADERDYLLLLETDDDLAGLPAEFRDAAAPAPPRSAATPGKLCGHAVALVGRAVPAILGAPRFARKSLARFRGARRAMAARATMAPS